jgi:hypothetical protein
MDMVKASRETKSFAVGLSMTVAGRVFAETVMLILMFLGPFRRSSLRNHT